jgi:succinate dehydrogenase/fumarate reductase flavoprotein subunit
MTEGSNGKREIHMSKKTQEGLTRRDFMKGAAAGAATGMVLGSASTALAAPETWGAPTTWDYSADVVVIGYGMAAQATAINAAAAGSTVLILEKATFKERGGNSRVCGQGILSPPPEIWAAYESYCKEATEGQGYPAAHGTGFTSDDTIKFYIEKARDSHAWFQAMGYPLIAQNNGGPGGWIPFYPTFPGADLIGTYDQYYTTTTDTVTYPKAHTGAGKMWYNLEDYIATQPKISIMYKSPAKRLIQNPTTREVLGVIITQNGVEKTVKARQAVSVCGGGYEFNTDMTHDFQHIIHVYSQGSPMNTGETIKMMWEAGAAPRNMGVVAAPTYTNAGIFPQYKGSIPLNATLTKGAFIMVGRNNKRFKDEYQAAITGIPNKAIARLEGTMTYSGQWIQNGAYVPQPCPEPMHYIFDKTALVAGAMFGSGMCWSDNIEGYKCSSDNSAELANGWIIQGATIAELAGKIGRDPVALQATIDKWNADCAAGRDTQFDTDACRAGVYTPYKRPAARLVPFTNGPFYAVENHQCTLNTQGGVVRNTNGQVMSMFDGNPIPRLYAAGENGDLWTILYQCMSNVGGGCLAYGRAGGTHAAGLTRWDASSSSKKAAKK